MKVKTIIFGGKQLQIGTYKPPIMIWPEIACTLIRKTPKLRSLSKIDQNRHDVESLKIAVNQAKFIFYRKSRFFQNWRVQMPNFICGLNNFSEVVSSPIAICSRWLTLWENQLFHAKNNVIFQVFLIVRNSYNYVTLLNDKNALFSHEKVDFLKE